MIASISSLTKSIIQPLPYSQRYTAPGTFETSVRSLRSLSTRPAWARRLSRRTTWARKMKQTTATTAKAAGMWS